MNAINYNVNISYRKEKKPMSKKKKHKSGNEKKTQNLLLATAVINFLIALLNLISNIFD